MIPLPFDSPDVARVVTELDADHARIASIRQSNVSNAALRHDWVHRLRTVFETLGLPPTEAMLAREERLRALSTRALRRDPLAEGAGLPGQNRAFRQ